MSKYQEFCTKFKALNPEAKKAEIDAAWAQHKAENPPATGAADHGAIDQESDDQGSEERPKFNADRAREIFASHKVDKIYFTADGTWFVEPQYARMHAATLESTDFTTVNREEV